MEVMTAIGLRLVTPISTEFGYIFNYHSNLNNLRGEIRKLLDKKDSVKGLVSAAQRNGESINPEVQSWLKNVNDMIQILSHFEDEINKKRQCMYRWSLSRKAYKVTQHVLLLQNEGPFNGVAHPAPPREIRSTFKKGFKDFKSRMSCMNEVIEGLKREEVRMIGICGMGGVGKTTMVKEIIKRLAKLNLFDKIVMATVSQSPSIRMIQTEIADKIGLKFEEETESGRALRLYVILKDIKRILIVLDDVWTELDFEAIGLPCGDAHEGCKVLLTSRNSEVCIRMGSQRIITVPVLTTEESQELFREMVGDSFNDPDLRSTAKHIVQECGGLPIAIVTVGKALEKKKKGEWDDALNQLLNSTLVDIPGVNDTVYSSIKWSYDRLESDEARSCLLLCCLFPDDDDIPIEYLVRYGWGRGYFSSSVTLEDARNRVHSLVDQLKRNFLLLDSGGREYTKMHEIVRDGVLWIASRDLHRYLVRCHAENKGWPSLATYDHYSTISLVGDLEIPVGLKCPKVELLQTMNGSFLEGSMDIICNAMTELKVLALVEMKDLGSSRSLGVLKNLQTLCLDNSNVDGLSTDVIGGLEKLEILSFRGCNSMYELTREIGRLKQLRLLDTTNCINLRVIPHGILSSLCRLEELYMLNSFDKWELATGRGDEEMASISEVMSMSDHLKVLAINIPSVNQLPKDSVLKRTIGFHIKLGPVTLHREPHPLVGYFRHENKLDISEGDARKLMESQAVLLLKISVCLTLRFVENLYVLADLDKEGFQHLKYLSLSNCPNTESLANEASEIQQTLFSSIRSISVRWMRKLKSICPNQFSESYFINLRSLELKYCFVLKYAFSPSVARNLIQLQKLVIGKCDQLEEIVSKQRKGDEEAADMIDFRKLTNLTLERLDSFVGFFQANEYSNQEVKTPKVEHQSTGLFEKAIFPSKCISWLKSLEEVQLEYLKPKDVIFDLKSHIVIDWQAIEDGQAIPIFSQLRKLTIIHCSFTHLWNNIPPGFKGFQNLRYLEIKRCSGLQYVFLHLIAKELLNLEEVKISECPDMETVVRNIDENEEEATKDMILFLKLNTFELVDLPRLTSLCPEEFTFLCSFTKSMHVENCEKLKTLGAVIPRRKMLENNFEKDFNTSPTRSSNWCPTGCGCIPFSRPNAHRSIERLQRPINLEVTPTNLADNLENLCVSDCASLEVIFQLRGSKHEESSHFVKAFNKLRSLWLHKLPSLKRVWETGSSQPTFTGSSFGNLKSLSVYCCNELKCLFSLSLAKLLVSIEDIEVMNCEQIEEIVAAENETDEIITFPKLKSIKLVSLPNLKYFCGEAYTLKLLSLELLKVINLQNLRLFAPKLIDTRPRLQVTELGQAEWTEDLNAHLRERMKLT